MNNDEKIKEYKAHKTPVPSYNEWKAKNEENERLKKQINHLSKTQARQFVDNQKLQVKAEKAKDVVNIDTARQIKQLKERNDSLNNRDINLCRIANGIRDENFALKELLKECLEVLGMVQGETIYFPRTVDECIDKINEVLK